MLNPSCIGENGNVPDTWANDREWPRDKSRTDEAGPIPGTSTSDPGLAMADTWPPILHISKFTQQRVSMPVRILRINGVNH